MKKIKITETQATLLGLDKLKEDEESGLKFSGVAIGEVVTRIVIEGQSVPKLKERIIQLITRQDPEAKVDFFPVTNKIVGNVKEIRVDSIKRDIKSLDPNIIVEKKPISKALKEGVKNIVKISKDQYNRVFAGSMINESEINGGLTRVDKTFKNNFTGKNIKTLKNVSELDSNFNITKPNTSLPMGKQHFEKPILEREDVIKKETIELIKYLYRKSENLSPFWEENGLDYKTICDDLLAKNIIISKDGRYELSKSLGDANSAIQAVENELRGLIAEREPVEKEIAEDNENVPADAETNSNAPWNEEPNIRKPKTPDKLEFKVLSTNYDISLLKGPDGFLYVFHFGFKDKEEFAQYAPVIRRYEGKDDEGNAEYSYNTDFKIDNDVISNYINDNLDKLSKGEGLKGWNEGVDLVKIDEPLKQEILSLFDKDKEVVKILGGITEVDQVIDKFKKNVATSFTPKPESNENPEDKKSRIIKKLQYLKNKEAERVKKEKEDNQKSWETGDVDETTGAGSSGAFTGSLDMPVIKKIMPETPVIDETTAGSGSVGAYDTNALPNINRDGSFKKGKKTKAEKVPQWAGGSFVKQPKCSKLNNNKEAQNGSCNQGASSLKTVKVKGSINAPSLDENTKNKNF